jgi:hypothetical protein
MTVPPLNNSGADPTGIVARDQRAVESEGATVQHAAAASYGGSVARDRGIGQG